MRARVRRNQGPRWLRARVRDGQSQPPRRAHVTGRDEARDNHARMAVGTACGGLPTAGGAHRAQSWGPRRACGTSGARPGDNPVRECDTQTWPAGCASVTGGAGARDVHARVSDGQRRCPRVGARVCQAALAGATGGRARVPGSAGTRRKHAAGPGWRAQQPSGERARERETWGRTVCDGAHRHAGPERAPV